MDNVLESIHAELKSKLVKSMTQNAANSYIAPQSINNSMFDYYSTTSSELNLTRKQKENKLLNILSIKSRHNKILYLVD